MRTSIRLLSRWRSRARAAVIRAQLLKKSAQWDALRLKQKTFKAFHELSRLFAAQTDAAAAREALCNNRLLVKVFPLLTSAVCSARQRRLAKSAILRDLQAKRASGAFLRWARYTHLRRQRADRYDSARAVHLECTVRRAFQCWQRHAAAMCALHTKAVAVQRLVKSGIRGRVFREWHQVVVHDVTVRNFRHR
jgi:hypothetical protein